MTTNKDGYMAEYKMELRVKIAFIASETTMKSAISGIPLIICNDRVKADGCATYHHELQLNGNRPNGTVARLLEMWENVWNIEMMTIAEHKELHYGDTDHYFGQTTKTVIKEAIEC